MTECPECGGSEWSTASDGLGSVASVAAVCVGCGYLTTSVVDVSNPPGRACLTCGYGADFCSESGCDGDVSLPPGGEAR